MPYPRLCAHRGLHRIAPENSLPAYGAAVALGAPEIELDLWATADGVLVSCHDERLERVSNGTGKIADYTLRELRELDFGTVYDPKYQGLRIPTFEEILSRFAGRCILNVHVKLWEVAGYPPMIDEVIEMIRRYDCERYVYLMIVNDEIHREVLRRAPDIATCVGWNGDKDPLSMPRRAIALGAKKVQLYKPYFNEETFALAKAHGVRCNVFWANDPAEARSFYEMGADTVLTDDYLPLSQALADILDTKQ
jgi:glycerophosphoryl diester phosphodiesterase